MAPGTWGGWDGDDGLSQLSVLHAVEQLNLVFPCINLFSIITAKYLRPGTL
jgi:hypothetical protein